MTQLTEIATRHQAHVERLKSHEVKAFNAFLKDMQRDTLYQLNIDGELTDFNRQRLKKKLSAVKKLLKEKYTDFKSTFDEIILDFAEYEAEFEKRGLESIIEHDFALPSSGQIKTAVFNNPLSISGADGGSLVDSFYKSWSNKDITRIVNQMNLGYAQGKTNIQIGRELKELGFGPADRNMKTLIRTTMQHASNQSRQTTWKANKDIIKSVEWVSTLDKRTSSLCQALDGKIYPIDKGPRPPAHPGCRSTTTAVLDDRFKVLEKGTTRASRDPVTGKVKSVSAKETYYSWLKKQPASVQDSIIGKSRGKLLRNGGLTTQRFTELQLHKNFTPMALDEMKELEPIAFEKANLN